SIDDIVFKAGVDHSILNRDGVGRTAVACPGLEIKMCAGGSAVSGNAANAKRNIGFANLWRSRDLQEVSPFAGPDHGTLAIGFYEHGGLLIDGNFARRL